MTPRIEIAASGRLEETFDGRRPRHVLAGEGMLTPIQPLEVHQDGKTEQLYPDSFRCSPDWWGVKERPELFRTCMGKDDKPTLARHRQLLKAAAKNLGRGETGDSAPARSLGHAPRWRLPRGPSHAWRLP